MLEELKRRENKIREFFGLAPDVKLLEDDVRPPVITPQTAVHLARFNIEWHVVPSEKAVPFDDSYLEKLYPLRSKDFAFSHIHHSGMSLRDMYAAAHRRHQGKIIGVESTVKPDYLPGNRQFYGTPYGFEPTADPFRRYLGRAGFASGTRYGHDYASLREMGRIINTEWRERGLMPEGYRLTLCPPLVFNLVGTLFHPEWSETRSLELSAFRDDHGNAICFAVGSNAPGDFSYVQRVETNSDWTFLGFRAALIPDRRI
jgi:hypothetical protein